jgi:glycosyltransferase involved in cell wall biosynthesis
MYCGNCLRDNALVRELRGLGHETLMVPLYLPMTLDEADESAGTPTFFGGISVYLEQHSALFRRAPGWFHKMLRSPALLKWAAGRTAKTRPEEVADLTVSMLRGEEGNQVRELEELVDWLSSQGRPDAICLSNVLLIGMARRLQAALKAPVFCTLQGEDAFLDALPAANRDRCYGLITERARELAGFVAPSRYFGDLMSRRLALEPSRVHVVHNGIDLDGYSGSADAKPGGPPAIGAFARMCPEKGLDVVVEAYRILRQRNRVSNVRLRIGGSCGPADEAFVAKQKTRLRETGLLSEVDFCPNLSRAEKIRFLQSLTVFSVPARSGEAFGLYVIEAWAAGVPVVQPRTAAFPELVESTGAGLLFAPENPQDLAEKWEELLLDREQAKEMGKRGRHAAENTFNNRAMAEAMLKVFRTAAPSAAQPPVAGPTQFSSRPARV